MTKVEGRIMNLLWYVVALYSFGTVTYLFLRLILSDRVWWLAFIHNFTPYVFVPLVFTLPISIYLRSRTSDTLTTGLLISQILLVIVVLVWFGPRFIPKTAPVSSGKPFKIITFNVFPHNPDLDAVNQWLREQDADVILIQEVQPETTAIKITEIGYPEYDIQPYSNGNMLLSRFPIVETGEFSLGEGWYDQVWSLQRVVIDVHGQHIAFYNTHLIMPLQDEPRFPLILIPTFITRYNEYWRNDQINRIIDIVKQEKLPFVLGGDFNMSDYSPIYGNLAAEMTDVFREVGYGMGLTWPAAASEDTGSMYPPLNRLDYLWLSEHLRPLSAEVGPKLGSDHMPLIAHLELKD